METWPLWKCMQPDKQAQFIQDIWDKFGVDLLKEDKPTASVTYSGKIESLEEIDKLMKIPTHPKGKVWFGG